jgi:beta-glucosidase
MRGEEVVQAYVSNLKAAVKVPVRSLAQFQRVNLATGESKQVDFTIAADAFAVFNEKGEKSVVPGEFEISIGGGQPLKVGGKEIPGVKTKINLR